MRLRTVCAAAVLALAPVAVVAAVGVWTSAPAYAASKEVRASATGPPFRWNPVSTSINVGDTIVWKNPNNGVAPHNAVCDAGAATCTSGNIDAGESGSFKFQTAGTFPFTCAFHPEMKGTIVVNAISPSPSPTSSKPTTKSPTPTPTTKSPTPAPTTQSPTPTPATKSPTPTPTTPSPTVSTPSATPTTEAPTATPTATKKASSSGGVSSGTIVWLLVGLAALLGLGGLAGLYFTRGPRQDFDD